MTTINRTQKQTADQKLMEGLRKHEATLPSFVLAGTSYKPGEAITVLQGLINAAQAVVESKAAWRATVATAKNSHEEKKVFVSSLNAALRAAFGGSIDTLADFGLAPRKRTARTPEQKAAATAKAKATRAARHTLGKKQKALIKGDVTKLHAPATAPAAVAPAAVAPAPAVPPAAAPALATSHS